MGTAGNKHQPEQLKAVEIINPDGASNAVLVCEHASRFIPERYNNLGLHGDALTAHVAWDPGALAVTKRISNLLDAPLVAANISRLVYDCNRPPQSESATPQVSEIFTIPGNHNLSAEQKLDRVQNIYEPFRATLSDFLAKQQQAGRAPIIITIHSFTPVFMGAKRSVEIGILHDIDTRLADAILASSKDSAQFDVRCNEPYGPEDGVTHTLKEHGLANGLHNVMIEIRNDLIADETAQNQVADWLADQIKTALSQIKVDQNQTAEGKTHHA